MNDYLLGLLTLPIAAAVVASVALVLKAAYIAAGRLGRVGIIRLGRSTQDQRYRYGACVAAAKHVVLFNRNSTGLILFTGEADDTTSRIYRLDAAMARAEREASA